MSNLAVYCMTLLVTLSPPDPAKHRPPPGWHETLEQRVERYQGIAADVAAVARTRVEAAVLLGVAWHESGFARDVDLGPCYQGPGFKGRCDGGRAVGMWQIQEANREKRDLWRQNRREAAREAWRRILMSRASCAKNVPDEVLALYASGNCSSRHGRVAARSLDHAIRRALLVRHDDVRHDDDARGAAR